MIRFGPGRTPGHDTMSTELRLPRALRKGMETLHGPVPDMPAWPRLLSHLIDGPTDLRKLMTGITRDPEEAPATP